jgi:two-component system cell cycle sensor histidine kinase PleC
MARAHAANASLRDQAVRGLARSLSRPAYQRILEAEPLLRRAVPVLIVVFLAVVGASAAMQIVTHRHQAIAEAQDSLVLMAGVAADNISKHSAKELKSKIGEILHKALPQHALAKGRQFFVTDAAGGMVASLPGESLLPPGQISRIGRSFAALADQARAADIALSDHSAGIAAVRNLPAPLGQLIAVQPAHRALEGWRSDSTLTVTLVTTTGVVLLILGFAFHWQATRARGGRDLRNGARPDRHRAQPRPLRIVGLGSRARAHLLVGFDVRDFGLRAARRTFVVRRGRQPRASRRRQPL